MVADERFVRIAVRCQCRKPRFYAVDVARVLLAGMVAGESPLDPDQTVFAFRCRGCGINNVTWTVVIRATRPLDTQAAKC